MRVLEFRRVDSEDEPIDGWDLARAAETYQGDRMAVLLVRTAPAGDGEAEEGKGDR